MNKKKILIRHKSDGDALEMTPEQFKTLLEGLTKSGALKEDGKNVIKSEHGNFKRTADFAMQDDEYLELCTELGYMPDPEQVENKELFDAHVKELSDEQKADPVLNKERILTFRGSDETLDSYGDIVRVKGWNLKRYRDNPVFLWAHNRRVYPVAKTVRVWKESNDPGAPNGKSLMFRVLFPENDTLKWTEEVYTMYKEGVLNGVSVGFNATSWNNPSSQEEREKIGLGPYGVEFLKQELLELSAVPIGANANALQVKSPELKEMAERIGLSVVLSEGSDTPEPTDPPEDKSSDVAQALERSIGQFTKTVGETLKQFEKVVGEFQDTAKALTESLQTIEVTVGLNDDAKKQLSDNLSAEEQAELERKKGADLLKQLIEGLDLTVKSDGTPAPTEED